MTHDTSSAGPLRKAPPYRSLAGLLALALLLPATACEEVEEFTEQFFGTETARERYELRMERAGLTGTALVADWLAAGNHALREAPLVQTPHVEEGYLPPGEPEALSFRLALRRGQQVDVEFNLLADTAALLFLDTWQAVEDTTIGFRHIASADSGVTTIHFEPRRDGEYIIRAQPELLRGGRYSVSIRVDGTLAFPVEGGGERDIGSVFGDPRDGGVRSHHGIDIFASRGTPALAAAQATVSRVQTTPIGGHVVWLRDARGNSLYYAHLDSQYVARGQRLEIGDTVGFVGNTGNARTTPPHLHFGVYSRGPVNPYWFVHSPRDAAPRIAGDTMLLGQWARTSIDAASLRPAPDRAAIPVGTLPAQTALRVIGAAGDWFRVRLPDGGTGFVAARQTEAATGPLRFQSANRRTAVMAQPGINADVVHEAASGDSLAVLGRFGQFLLVRPEDGRAGWITQ